MGLRKEVIGLGLTGKYYYFILLRLLPCTWKGCLILPLSDQYDEEPKPASSAITTIK
jgi:hypothetical protein